jgi:quercetin dioxygenase-like cupin family protein
MTDDPRHHDSTMEDQAALYALGALGDVEAKQFEQSLPSASGAMQGLAGAFHEVAAELAFIGAAMAPPRSLKDRLMARIAAEPQDPPAAKPFVFVRASERDWREVEPGVSVKVLFFDSAAHRVTTLVRLAPGGRFSAHRHEQVEELYVLEGSCICAGEQLQAGDYHRAASASIHPVTYSEHGCLALVMTSSNNEPIG